MVLDEKRTYVGNEPYFILERGNGLFEVITSIKPTEEEWDSEYDEDIGTLRLGLDIIEKPTRDISYLLRHTAGEFFPSSIVKYLKKIAQVTFSDYVTYETFGDHMALLFKQEGNILLYEIKPRLFRKINP